MQNARPASPVNSAATASNQDASLSNNTVVGDQRREDKAPSCRREPVDLEYREEQIQIRGGGGGMRDHALGSIINCAHLAVINIWKNELALPGIAFIASGLGAAWSIEAMHDHCLNYDLALQEET